MVVKTNKQKKQEAEAAEQKKIAESAAGTTAEGQYPGRVNQNFFIGGQQLSREDYEKAKGLIETRTQTGAQQLEKVSPEAKTAVEASNLFEAQQGRATEAQKQAIIKQELDKTKAEQISKLPTIEQEAQKLETETQAEFERRRRLAKVSLGLTGAPLLEQAGATAETTAGLGKSILSTAAQAYDIIKNSLLFKKSTGVQKAEQSFTDAAAILRNDVEQVKAGTKPYEEAQRNFGQALASLARLEREASGKGKLNLRYWLDSGKELETQIALEKSILDSLRADLEAARLSSATTALGLR